MQLEFLKNLYLKTNQIIFLLWKDFTSAKVIFMFIYI